MSADEASKITVDIQQSVVDAPSEDRDEAFARVIAKGMSDYDDPILSLQLFHDRARELLRVRLAEAIQ